MDESRRGEWKGIYRKSKFDFPKATLNERRFCDTSLQYKGETWVLSGGIRLYLISAVALNRRNGTADIKVS